MCLVVVVVEGILKQVKSEVVEAEEFRLCHQFMWVACGCGAERETRRLAIMIIDIYTIINIISIILFTCSSQNFRGYNKLHNSDSLCIKVQVFLNNRCLLGRLSSCLSTMSTPHSNPTDRVQQCIWSWRK